MAKRFQGAQPLGRRGGFFPRDPINNAMPFPSSNNSPTSYPQSFSENYSYLRPASNGSFPDQQSSGNVQPQSPYQPPYAQRPPDSQQQPTGSANPQILYQVPTNGQYQSHNSQYHANTQQQSTGNPQHQGSYPASVNQLGQRPHHSQSAQPQPNVHGHSVLYDHTQISQVPVQTPYNPSYYNQMPHPSRQHTGINPSSQPPLDSFQSAEWPLPSGQGNSHNDYNNYAPHTYQYEQPNYSALPPQGSPQQTGWSHPSDGSSQTDGHGNRSLPPNQQYAQGGFVMPRSRPPAGVYRNYGYDS